MKLPCARWVVGVAILLLALRGLGGAEIVLRDSIGNGPSNTNGMPGGLTHHDGADWNTPGLVVNVPVDGELTQAKFVIFGRGPGPVFPPENNLANMYGFPMEFHIWTGGVQGGPDSFDENPRGVAVPGHIDLDVNTPTTSFITVAPFGITGPVNEFTTFLLTVDLSSFNLQLAGGKQYVMGLIQDNESNFVSGGGIYRISASRATGFEDVFRSFQTPTSSEYRPGYVKSQLGNNFEQYAGAFTLTTQAPLTPGDFDLDGDVDGADFVIWQSNFPKTSGAALNQGDADGDGDIDGADFVVWQTNFPYSPSPAASPVPEPGSFALALVSLPICVAFARMRRLTRSQAPAWERTAFEALPHKNGAQ